MHAGSMLLECLDSDADVSVVIVLHQWLRSTSNKTTQETLANSHCGLGMRPRQDYTHIMLNNCVSAHWDPMCQCLALTSL